MSNTNNSKVSSQLAPKKKSNKKTAKKIYEIHSELLKKSLHEKQVTKKQYKTILSAIEQQYEGKNVNVAVKGVFLKDAGQSEWTVTYNVIDELYTK